MSPMCVTNASIFPAGCPGETQGASREVSEQVRIQNITALTALYVSVVRKVERFQYEWERSPSWVTKGRESENILRWIWLNMLLVGNNVAYLIRNILPRFFSKDHCTVWKSTLESPRIGDQSVQRFNALYIFSSAGRSVSTLANQHQVLL